MIFAQEYVAFELLDVLYLDQSDVRVYNTNRNFDALSFRLEADTELETEQNTAHLTAGALCYSPANVSYTRRARTDKLIVVHFKSFNYHSSTLEFFKPETPAKYETLFREILKTWNARETAYKDECASQLSRIFAQLYKDNRTRAENSKIGASLRYLEQNMYDPAFSLSEAAGRSFVSETYFRKLFKKEFGISPKQYVIRCRIDYAKALLLAGYFTVQEVSSLCGYADSKHFSVEFKRLTGVSPTGYIYNYGKSP